MAVATRVIEAVTRPHFPQDCWCKPVVCEGCGGVEHRNPDVRPDVQYRMAIFSDQRAICIA